jgi:hypothetical protein
MITVTLTLYYFAQYFLRIEISFLNILDHLTHRLAYTICFPGVRTYVPILFTVFL